MRGSRRGQTDCRGNREAKQAMRDVSGRDPVFGLFRRHWRFPGGSRGRAVVLAVVAAILGMGLPAAVAQTLPVVTITADAAEVMEGETAHFTIRRTGSTTPTLRGSLYVRGANPAFTWDDGWAFVFRLNEAEKGFQVQVLDDGIVTADRQVTVRVDHLYDTYTPGDPPSSATVTVLNTTVPVVAPPTPDPPVPVDFELPNDLQPQTQALGDRARDPAKARTTMAGTFVNAANASSAITVIQQTTGHLRVEGLKTNGVALAFDGAATLTAGTGPSGTRSAGVLTHADQGIVESFALDTVVGLLTSADRGAAAVLLGQGFRPDASVAPNYTGPSYDIFEMVGQVDVGGTVSARGKRYYFDSATGLLLRTFYTDGVAVETRFSNWTAVDGSMYPLLIQRYEGANMVFSFTTSAAEITADAAQASQTFTRP